MFRVRKSGDRGHFNHGWLDTYHTFSFADYYDLQHMGFRSLRVINEDRVQPEMGFGMHGHRDMEIVTYVLEGELEHKDSMGTRETLRRNEFQRMSAGTGIRHSEANPSMTETVHLYQIWLLPSAMGIQPSYEQKYFAPEQKKGKLRLVASPNGADGSLTIHTDAKVYLSTLDSGESVKHDITPGRHAWLQVLRGSVKVQGTALDTSDGLAASDEIAVVMEAERPAEIMLFDLA